LRLCEKQIPRSLRGEKKYKININHILTKYFYKNS
jgi:hypothetical protein